MQEQQKTASERMALYTGNNKPPCKNCTERHATCHATCERFAIWEGEHRAKKERELSIKKPRYECAARRLKGVKPTER